jgi:MFS family permease
VQAISILDYTAYFALTNVGVVFLSEDFGFSDRQAGWAFTLLTSSVALCLLLMGSVADWLGIRRSLKISMSGMLISRLGIALCALLPNLPYRGELVVVALGLMAPFVALWQTTKNAAIKRFTDEQSRGAGFNLAYLSMNAGAFIAGLLIDLVRLKLGVSNGWIIVFGVFSALASLIITLRFIREEDYMGNPEATPTSRGRHPLANTWLVIRERTFWRFIVLVVLLLGVRLIFVWGSYITPKFALRVIGPDAPIGLLSTINPTVIVLGLILLIPILRRYNVFSMLAYGAMVSAGSVFLMVYPSWGATAAYFLIVYTVIFSIGEFIWSPRLTEYTVAIAPRGQEATYVGLASFPVFLAKTIGSALSGSMLSRWIPELPNGEVLRDRLAAGKVSFADSPSALWLLVGMLAMIGPVIALMFRGWFERPTRAPGVVNS